MKNFVLAAAAALLLSTAAQAKDFNIPSEKPVAAISMPDGWTANETDSGLEGTSADSAVYFAADISETGALDKTIPEAAKFLEDQGVKIDLKTESRSRTRSTARTPSSSAGPAPTRTARPRSASPSSFSTRRAPYPDLLGHEGEEDKHGAEINSIIGSIKAAKVRPDSTLQDPKGRMV